jgi:hypothetical protein
MITTNMPQLVQQLSMLGDVSVHDTLDGIQLKVEHVKDIGGVDDLLCDALFADPLKREADAYGWTIHLYKREHLRPASDMRTIEKGGTVRYELLRA